MEFHIARAVRDKFELDDLLFSYSGNVVFGNVAASRKLAQQLSAARKAGSGSEAGTAASEVERAVNGGALFAMGLIDELNHALIARFRKEIDPPVLAEAMRFFAAEGQPEQLEALLLAFTEEFPNVAVYRGELTAAEWLKGTTDGLPNREAALEELMLLTLANLNPAFQPFAELFEDRALKQRTILAAVNAAIPKFFSGRPAVSAEFGSLWDALYAPILASPDSLTGQLDYIRERWTEHLGEDLRRVLLAIDVIREEDIAVWMRFHPPGPDEFRHGAPTWGTQGFVGDEYVGFDNEYEYVAGPGGSRIRARRYAADYQAPLEEYEAFSADQAWMPNVVLMAKSTYVWLEQLSQQYGRHIHRLDQIPDEALQTMARQGITGLWLIGLWERSTASRTIKRLRGHGDAVASAYSLKGYQIAQDLGGDAGYEHLKQRASAAGLRLASDMVPNHMGIDSEWVIEHPEWFISRDESPFPVYSFNGPDLSDDSRVEIKIEDHYYEQTDAAVVFRLRHFADNRTRYLYHGNDGTTFAWNDTAQLDYSKAQVREHVIQTILHVARLFPIIRFDAAMVLAKRHVQRLWFPLPGAGGSIPSRAEDAMSQEQFDALMPHEFWREVVDRVAVEVPGTLLLAEAFWLLEGYFVRTLGMHRVYNSAFMNMLRDEENAKYRSYLQKTIEFDPDILKRYVNFMSNPDERTAIDQFGNGDKYLGVATLLATLPGLPMFGHGQIEGFTERYGMEFKQAKMREVPDAALVARHQAEIAPLLKNRRIFAESDHFTLYDFWNEHGAVDENVFAYSNRLGEERSVILYNNAYESTSGTIHKSAMAMDKPSGEMRERSLSAGLAVTDDAAVTIAYRDVASGLEYLRPAREVAWQGLRFNLQGYQRIVLLDWRELRSTETEPWDRLCDELAGRGVPSLREALARHRLTPLHAALREALSPGHCAILAALADAALVAPEPADAVFLPQQHSGAVPPTAEPVIAPVAPASDGAVRAILDHAQRIFDRACDIVPAGVAEGSPSKKFARAAFGADLLALARLPAMQLTLAADWPAAARALFPATRPEWAVAQTWSAPLAFLLLRGLPSATAGAGLYDSLHLREMLGETFRTLGLGGDAMWRAAARVRLLLAYPEPMEETLGSAAFWSDADVRWLSGVNESDGRTYFNQEQFGELLGWLALPELVKIGARKASAGDSDVRVELPIASAVAIAAEAGYDLSEFQQLWSRRSSRNPELPDSQEEALDEEGAVAQVREEEPVAD